MPATALLDLPADLAARRATYTGSVLGLDVVVRADAPVRRDALQHLLRELDDRWDLRRRRSDLARVTRRPYVMVPVSPVTLLLARVALLRGAPGLGAGCLDRRHGRVGLSPAAAVLAGQLAPAVAADLVVGLLQSGGTTAGQVRLGDAVRELEHPRAVVALA